METSKTQLLNAIAALNNAFKADDRAIWTLMNTYTPCNEALANHPTVQVFEKDVEGKKQFTVGPLGLINGVIEAALGHRICLMTSEPDEKGQRKVLGFDIYQAPIQPEQNPKAVALAEASNNTLSVEEAASCLRTIEEAFKEKVDLFTDAAVAISEKLGVPIKTLAQALEESAYATSNNGMSFFSAVAINALVAKKTARDGVNIGQALNGILTALQRVDTRIALATAGVELLEPTGDPRSAIKILENLARLPNSIERSRAIDAFGVKHKTYLNAILASLRKDSYDDLEKALPETSGPLNDL